MQTKNSPGVTTGGQTTWDFHDDGDDVVIMLMMVVTILTIFGVQTTLTLHWAKME